MTTLAATTLSLARVLCNVRASTATGGSATTLVDTSRTEPDDFFTGGCIWFLSGANVDKSAVITDWDLATKTFTFATQTALVAGVLYAASPWDYPRDKLMEAVNNALQSLDNIPNEDTSLTTVESLEEYSVPSGCEDIRRVEIATGTAAPYRYNKLRHWEVMPGTGKLRLPWDVADYLETGFKIRITYTGRHTDLTTDAGVVSAYIHPDVVKWGAVVHALRLKIVERGEDDATSPKLLNDATAQYTIALAKHPIPDIPKDYTYPAFTDFYSAGD